MENCLPFGLLTLSFILNLFAIVFYWVLQSFLRLDLEHYLDNFVAFFPAVEATFDRIRIKSNNYACLIDILEIPQQEIKNLEGTLVPIFGIEVDTNLFTMRLTSDILYKVCELSVSASNKKSITVLEAETLIGLLSFNAKVVRLG